MFQCEPEAAFPDAEKAIKTSLAFQSSWWPGALQYWLRARRQHRHGFAHNGRNTRCRGKPRTSGMIRPGGRSRVHIFWKVGKIMLISVGYWVWKIIRATTVENNGAKQLLICPVWLNFPWARTSLHCAAGPKETSAKDSASTAKDYLEQCLGGV